MTEFKQLAIAKALKQLQLANQSLQELSELSLTKAKGALFRGKTNKVRSDLSKLQAYLDIIDIES